jgi:hypothetical protein
VRYVDARNTSSPYSGTWKDPYRSLDQLDQSGTGDGAYWVLLSGTHTFTGTLDTPVAEIVTRRGASTIREDAPRWRDEPDLSRSTDPAIVAGIAAVRAADRAGDREGAISALRALAAATAGDERTVVELEIAQRLGQLGRGDDAIALYRSIGDRTDDPYLRAETASQIGFIARWRAHEGRRKGQPDAAPKQAPDRLDDPGARDSGLDGAAMPARPAERAEGRLPTREIRPTTRRAEGPKASPRERVAASRLRGPVEGTGWPAVGETSVTRPSPGEAEHTPETGGSSRSMRALSGFALVAACTLVHRAWRRRRG